MEPRSVAVLSVISIGLLACYRTVSCVNTTAIHIPDYMWQIYLKGSSSANTFDIARSLSGTLISNQCFNSKHQIRCEAVVEFNCTLPPTESLSSADVHFSQPLTQHATIRVCEFTGSRKSSNCIVSSETGNFTLCVTEQVQRLLTNSDHVRLSFVLTIRKISPNLHITQVSFDNAIALILYSRDENATKSYRRKRDIEFEDMEEDSNRIWDNQIPNLKSIHSPTPKAKTKKGAKNNNCRRRPMHVDFTIIHYDTWIIAPRGYEAYECVGRCQFPLSDHLTPTKHTIIQALLHTVTPDKVTRPCCVPTRLEPISLLYVDDEGIVTYKYNYEDMVIAECGCR